MRLAQLNVRYTIPIFHHGTENNTDRYNGVFVKYGDNL